MNGMYFGSNRVMGAKRTSRERFAKLFIHWNNGWYDQNFFRINSLAYKIGTIYLRINWPIRDQSNKIRYKNKNWKKLVNWLMSYYSITIKITLLVWICMGEEVHAMNNKKIFFSTDFKKSRKIRSG